MSNALSAPSPAAIPICKLRGLPSAAQRKLKFFRIVKTNQLCEMASSDQQMLAFARSADIDPDLLLDLAQQADLLRVNGIGIMFMLMVKNVGISSVAALALQDPERLHASLCAYNKAERMTRRSPTLEEVRDWLDQAEDLVSA